jgi:hypothetical protein
MIIDSLSDSLSSEESIDLRVVLGENLIERDLKSPLLDLGADVENDDFLRHAEIGLDVE